jgi:YVTN family beta-propeller protein
MPQISRILSIVICLIMSALSVSAAEAHGTGPFKVVNKFPLTGEGRWDYLIFDNQSRRLFLSRTSHVVVLDADSGQSVGEIADTPGVHGIALAPELGVGFVTDGGENKVTVFDLQSLKAQQKIDTGGNPDSILYDPDDKLVFAQNGKSNSSTVIDASKREVVATIPLPGKPEFAAYDGKGSIYINIEDKSSLVHVDIASKQVKDTWKLTGCEEPSGLAIDRKSRTLFAACDNKVLAVVEADSGKVTQTLPIGDDCDAVAYDSETGYVFASAGEGKLTVIRKGNGGKYSVVQNLSSPQGSKTMALDTGRHQIYLPAAKFTGDPTKRPRPSVVPGSASILVIGDSNHSK